MSLNTLKQKAFLNPDVKVEYDKLECEFCLDNEVISMKTKEDLPLDQVNVKIGTLKSNDSHYIKPKL